MASHEGGRWDVDVENDAVHVERISDGGTQVFEDFLASEEARELAGLLTKFADTLDKSDESGESDESEETAESDKSEDSSD